MVGPERLLHNLEGALEMRLGLGVSALLKVEFAQASVAEASLRVISPDISR